MNGRLSGSTRFSPSTLRTGAQNPAPQTAPPTQEAPQPIATSQVAAHIKRRISKAAASTQRFAMNANKLVHGDTSVKFRRTKEQKLQQNLVPPSVLLRLQAGKRVCIANPHHTNSDEVIASQSITSGQIEDARQLLDRAKPLFRALWPEDKTLEEWNGLIESKLTSGEELRKEMDGTGKWLFKRDDDLPVAGSIKGRGAFFAVLEHAEKLALQHGIIKKGEDLDLAKLATPEARKIFQNYSVAVGSTGNLGMGIALLAARLGFKASVYLSQEAADWKKTRLTSNGVEIVEHEGNFQQALQAGRDHCDKLNSENKDSAYFVDDEDSMPLSVGPTVAGQRMKEQLEAQNIPVDVDHPLFVYIPTGVGGGPSGVLRGLIDAFQAEGKHHFIHGILVQPKQCASVLARMSVEDEDSAQAINVYDLQLSNKSPRGDGMAVPQASELAYANLKVNAAGAMTVSEKDMLKNTARLHKAHGIVIETTSAASLNGPQWCTSKAGRKYISERGMEGAMANATHVMWFTGGGKVPGETKAAIMKDGYAALGEEQTGQEIHDAMMREAAGLNEQPSAAVEPAAA